MDPSYDAQYFRQDAPWRFIRYTEILLNYAECCLALGQEGEARTYINMIRRRAGMPDIPDSVTGTALLDRYRNERYIELAMEDPNRFFDIRRWMIGPEAYVNAVGVDIWHLLNPDHETHTTTYNLVEVQQRGWNDKYYLIPIGKNEMDKNPNLFQNPLY
jgi:starch-binding outer membrane protein, SusD/RagB family